MLFSADLDASGVEVSDVGASSCGLRAPCPVGGIAPPGIGLTVPDRKTTFTLYVAPLFDCLTIVHPRLERTCNCYFNSIALALGINTSAHIEY